MFLFGLSIGIIGMFVLLIVLTICNGIGKKKETEQQHKIFNYWNANTNLHRVHNRILDDILQEMRKEAK